MWKNPNYLYANKKFLVPLNLNFGDYILSKLWEYGEKIAIINGETHEKLTYKQMAQEAMTIALSLVRIGVRKGDVVAICSENRQEFYSTVIGIICAGAVVTAINFGYSRDELKHVMSISKPKYVFFSPRAYKSHINTLPTVTYIEKIIIFGNEVPKGVLSYNDLIKGFVDRDGKIKNVSYEEFQSIDVNGQEDTAFLLYSSGTTGLAKGVMLTHLNMLAMSVQPETLNINNNALVITPWYHSMGLASVFFFLAVGRTVIYLSKFEPDLYLKTIEKYRVAHLTVVPPVLVAVTKCPSDHDLSSVTMIVSGAAPLRSDTINAICSRFPNAGTVNQGYGMTETTLGVCRSYYEEIPPVGSVGKVVRGTIAKIVDIETRKPLGRFQEGEICVKGPLIMKGYVGKDRAEDFDDEGFFKTGDIAYYDENENVFIVGRLKELIKYKGYQVPPAEIEGVLLRHPSIRDAGVIGVPNDDAGEVPMAFVVLQPGATLTEHEVKQFVAENLSNPKHLRGGVQFVPEIPKNPSGKILRRHLYEMFKIRKSKL